MKYALTETLDDNELWLSLVKSKILEAEYVEFNTLYKSNTLIPELEDLRADLLQEGKRKDKVYPSGKYRRYKLTDKLIKFILSKSYASWRNYQFEDLSLIKNGQEILATITHENYVFIAVTEEERIDLNKKGYNFGELFELKFE